MAINSKPDLDANYVGCQGTRAHYYSLQVDLEQSRIECHPYIIA